MVKIIDEAVGYGVPRVIATEDLTDKERAYRRGCLQAIQFLKAELDRLQGLGYNPSFVIAQWEQALVAGRDSLDVAYQGHYLDAVRDKLHQESLKEEWVI